MMNIKSKIKIESGFRYGDNFKPILWKILLFLQQIVMGYEISYILYL